MQEGAGEAVSNEAAKPITLAELEAFKNWIETEERKVCGSAEKPHVCHPNYPDGPCLNCGARRP